MTDRYSTDFSTDIVIIGGGIAGLWLLNLLQQHGYEVLLLEKSALGNGQTIASQGIIHGGLKYALSGVLDGGANAIAKMPERWRDCLAGTGEIDLTACKVESQHYYMWSRSGFRSRIKTFLGSKSLQGRIEPVASHQYPDFFLRSVKSGKYCDLYRLPDFVVNTTSLLQSLSAPHTDRIVKIAQDSLSFNLSDQGPLESISVETDGKSVTISAQRFILAAGESNQQLLEAVNISNMPMQTRPLQMVYIKKAGLPSLHVHCIGNDFSLTPELTVTSHLAADGDQVWYLGGELAESGVGKSSIDLIAAAKKRIADFFPWVDISDAHWQCFSINRAEAKMAGNHRPDYPYMNQLHNMIVSWPTKLTLTPALGDLVLEALRSDAITPGSHENSFTAADLSGPVPAARPDWDQ